MTGGDRVIAWAAWLAAWVLIALAVAALVVVPERVAALAWLALLAGLGARAWATYLLGIE